jgi:hypothetical protein
MSHPLVLALFDTPEAAAEGARVAHALGVDRQDLSIVARSHEEAGKLSQQMDGTPGADIEDSRMAARLGELGGRILAAIALVMPGIGPIVAGGPLSAELGEVAGHAAGGVAVVLERTGLDAARASQIQARIEAGAVLLGVHVRNGAVEDVQRTLESSGATDIELATWPVTSDE